MPSQPKVFHFKVTSQNNKKTHTYYITRYGTSDEDLSFMFPEHSITVREPSIHSMDATEYEKKFNQLTFEEKKAVRTWTAFDEKPPGPNMRQYSDGTSYIQSSINYELNEKLAKGELLDNKEKRIVKNLDSALKKLPHFQFDTIRISIYKESESIPWNNKITIGDFVTNYPLYMSSSDSTVYSADTVDGLSPIHENVNAHIIYKIKNSHMAVPLLQGTASLASEESEYLFRRDSVFQVKGITIAKKTEDFEDDIKIRIGVILEGMPPSFKYENIVIKNIHNGNDVDISYLHNIYLHPKTDKKSELINTLSCSNARKKRSANRCIDSRDENTQEERKRAKELLESIHKPPNAATFKLYNILLELHKKATVGKALTFEDTRVLEQALSGVDVSQITDPNMRQLLEELTQNLEKPEEIKGVFKQTGIGEKIGKAVEGVGMAYTVFLVGKHLDVVPINNIKAAYPSLRL